MTIDIEQPHLTMPSTDNSDPLQEPTPIKSPLKDQEPPPSKQQLIHDILRLESDLEYARQRVNNDRTYIRLLREYNYLKDAAFELVGIVAGMSRRPVKEVFEEFDVIDVEKESIPEDFAKKPKVSSTSENSITPTTTNKI